MKISISRKFYSGTLHFIQIFWFFPFLGIFTSETRCLNCETVTSKDEDFFDLSIDVEQNTSITSCLKNFSNTETLCSDNKFQCDSCCTLQEAHVSIFKKFFLDWIQNFLSFEMSLVIFIFRNEWESRNSLPFWHYIWNDSSTWNNITVTLKFHIELSFLWSFGCLTR